MPATDKDRAVPLLTALGAIATAMALYFSIYMIIAACSIATIPH